MFLVIHFEMRQEWRKNKYERKDISHTKRNKYERKITHLKKKRTGIQH